MRFSPDRWAVVLLVLFALVLAGKAWLRDHPQHDPGAPLTLNEPEGWATGRKRARLRDEPAECRAFLDRSRIAYAMLAPVGDGACRREDRTVPVPDEASGLTLRPTGAAATCAVNAGLALWLRHGVQPVAERQLGSRVVALEHLGTASCRRIGGEEGGRWSEHATGNAIDVAGFVLADGRRISVLRDWDGDPDRAAFLHAARDSACEVFGTALSPDYNAAHADHLHLDQAGRGRGGWRFCR